MNINMGEVAALTWLPSLEASKYIPILEESTGGDFGLEILEDRDVFDDDEFDDEFDDEYDEEEEDKDNKTM
ncbi:hypothetical protein [Parabacteroides sp. AM58-2XD]|uniref:hypothetical protein n=1 Tax=Parabacteroides sp. AM58-2XD TaxID=2292362 RepID=UPI0013142616|nr:MULTISPECIES: hypothetical protein [Parabacteroides]